MTIRAQIVRREEDEIKAISKILYTCTIVHYFLTMKTSTVQLNDNKDKLLIINN